MSSYYKYCPVYSHEKLQQEYSLINLFSNQVSFSRRGNFNDLFDSKVDFLLPSKDKLKLTYHKLTGQSKREFKQRFLGQDSSQNLNKLHGDLNSLLDSYLFYCLTDNATNNLMWSHYANSHNGFCIEWNGDEVKPEKVEYKKKLPTINIIDLLEANLKLRSSEELEKSLWLALKVKLDEWEYESEYRFNLSNTSKHLIVKDHGKFALVQSQPEWIKSIIFGYRMPNTTRDYIVRNMPKNTHYKEVIIAPDNCSLRIRDV
ncbi:DUF2971 domain-containing protein [Plesiomonas shigelloides]|uniref:DUF2971 domain-containing protein n=1 Tax=Plesiomonas shigelloides TaxID=703 RepID=UPI0030BCB1D0